MFNALGAYSDYLIILTYTNECISICAFLTSRKRNDACTELSVIRESSIMCYGRETVCQDFREGELF